MFISLCLITLWSLVIEAKQGNWGFKVPNGNFGRSTKVKGVRIGCQHSTNFDDVPLPVYDCAYVEVDNVQYGLEVYRDGRKRPVRMFKTAGALF